SSLGISTYTMARFPVIMGALMVLLALPAALGQNGVLKPRPELLVSPEWLSAHLKETNLRIVDLRDEKAYRRAHIPGAVHFPSNNLFAKVNGVVGMLPDVRIVAEKLSRAGIDQQTVVVAYDDAWGLYATRLFWALDYIGQGKGRVLDGGWSHWRRLKLPVSSRIPRVAAARLTPRSRPELLAGLEWMRRNIKAPGTVYVDARSSREYRGVTQYAKYRGHIPGAVSFEWKRHLRSGGTMRPAEDLLAKFKSLGVTPDKEVAVYCQVMVRAAHSYFTLKWLGFPRVRGYDGSWAEWGNRDDTPKEIF
ncbi:MAG: sulfurtransferase, partial [bacterium]